MTTSTLTRKPGAVPAMQAEHPLSRVAFGLFMALIVTTLVNLPSRIVFIQYLRPTVLLVGAITVLIYLSRGSTVNIDRSNTSKLLMVLVGYVIVAIPLAEWPGSALGRGLENFVKAIIFFFFPLYLVTTYQRLRTFILVFVVCQVFRILEPLFLHLTTGYWGSQAHMAGGQFMDRLAGAPHDSVNPNGLAFVIMTALPFLHYLLGGHRRWLAKLLYPLLLPALLYTLVLTGSRSGMVGLAVIYFFVIARSKHRGVLIVCAVVAMAGMVPVMDDNLRDRYLSLVSDETQNAGTRDGRINGVLREVGIGKRRPLFGHGIGTSREANANFGGIDQLSHNLYTEVFIELGIFGLAIFLAVMVSVVRNVLRVHPAVRGIWRLARETGISSKALRVRLHYYQRCAEAIFVFTMMCIVFSLASYGLSEFYWYLLAGMSVGVINVVGADTRRIMVVTRSLAAESSES